jgi:hypothetical protein
MSERDLLHQRVFINQAWDEKVSRPRLTPSAEEVFLLTAPYEWALADLEDELPPSAVEDMKAQVSDAIDVVQGHISMDDFKRRRHARILKEKGIDLESMPEAERALYDYR